jgi:hypothetical protein
VTLDLTATGLTVAVAPGSTLSFIAHSVTNGGRIGSFSAELDLTLLTQV